MQRITPSYNSSGWLSAAGAVVLLAACGSTGRGAPAEFPPPGIDALDAADAVGEAYTMGTDDHLHVRVFGAPELTGEVRVTSTGDVSIPLVGPVRAAGLTPRELEEAIEHELRDTYMWDPRVTVQILEARSQVVSTVYVLGDVRQPGGYPLERGEPISVIQAVALAEGLESTAAAGRARIIREHSNGAREEIEVDLREILEGNTSGPLLRHRDVLFVPNSRSRSLARGVWGTFVSIFTLRGFLR